MLGNVLLSCDRYCSMMEDVVGRRVSTAMDREYKGIRVVVKSGYVSYTGK